MGQGPMNRRRGEECIYSREMYAIDQGSGVLRDVDDERRVE
jgi:hypothetical protein